MNTYLALKHTHLLMVALVGALFLLRGALLLRESPALEGRALRILPHVLSLLLLLSGLAMVAEYGRMPGWVAAKLALLFVFIAVGVVTFKRARTRVARMAGLMLGLLIYVAIVGIAVHHGSWPA